MANINFKEIELSDSAWIRELFSVPDFNSEDYCFTFQYLWKNTFKSKVARVGDLVLIQYNMGYGRSYLMPVGKADDWQVADLLNAMLSTASANSQSSPLTARGSNQSIQLTADGNSQSSPITAGGSSKSSLLSNDGKLVLYGVLPSHLDFFEKHFSGKYTAELFRMGADYIYDAESLKTLRGKKYQSKRNFANGFRRLYNWRFEPITEENVPECLEMNDEWCRRGGCSGDFWKSNEFCATRVALSNFKALGLDGALLRVFPAFPEQTCKVGQKVTDCAQIHTQNVQGRTNNDRPCTEVPSERTPESPSDGRAPSEIPMENAGFEIPSEKAGFEIPANGKVVAFSIAEKTNSNTLIVHIEKALTEYRGAYQAMSQEFLNYMDGLLRERENLPEGAPAFTLVNREDDSGDENLRKAKLEYHPIEIKEKYLVTLTL